MWLAIWVVPLAALAAIFGPAHVLSQIAWFFSKLAVVTFNADSFRGQATASDAEVASYFDGHKDDFKIPEKRKIRYILLDIEAIRAKVAVPPLRPTSSLPMMPLSERVAMVAAGVPS